MAKRVAAGQRRLHGRTCDSTDLKLRSIDVSAWLCRIPALAEVLKLVAKRAEAGQRGGAYLETKEPAFHDARGLPLEVHLSMRQRSS